MQAVESLIKTHVPPWLMSNQIYDILGETPDDMDKTFPLRTSNEKLALPTADLSVTASFMFAKKSKDGQRMPQTIAHRGYKAKHPENTMGAFRGAVAVGADAIETDVHITKDGVVVLSHDGTLKRCFDKDAKIIDCSWEYISSLRTLKEPRESMPRLIDILEYLTSPGLEYIWLLLDIKVDNDAETVMRLIGETIRSVPPNPQSPWNERVVLGCWAVRTSPLLWDPLKYLPLCAHHLPNFPITHIGFSTGYARRFLSIPNISFNLLQKTLFLSTGFIGEARRLDRPLVVWTVNDDEMMRWSISKGVDGVITDDPKRFREVSDAWMGGRRKVVIRWKTWVELVWIQLMVIVFGGIFHWKMRAKGQGKQKVGMEEQAQEAEAIQEEQTEAAR
ncbi:hypothetical protein MMC18_003437 [Xylographa bjoerkii]|nr:hypothetical protein [Xylographa bjoerkii]